MSRPFSVLSLLMSWLLVVMLTYLERYALSVGFTLLVLFVIGYLKYNNWVNTLSCIGLGAGYIFIDESITFNGLPEYQSAFSLQLSFVMALAIVVLVIPQRPILYKVRRVWIIWSIFLIFLLVNAPLAVLTNQLGRSAAYALYYNNPSFKILGQVAFSFGLLLPALLIKINTSHVVKFSAISIVAIIYVLLGNRIGLLFAMMPLLVLLERTNRAKFLWMIPIFLLLAVYTKGSRNLGESSSRLIEKQQELGSNEHVIYGTLKLIESQSILYYPRYTSVPFYFFIPRIMWESKPRMLGYEFVREYSSGFGKGHSASYGLAGEFYADFGGIGLIFFVLIVGLFLLYIGNRMSAFTYIFMLPLLFFVIRSPFTGLITTLPVIVIINRLCIRQ